MTKPRMMTTEVFNALRTPFNKSDMPGTNFRKRNDLNTLKTLNTRKKLTLDKDSPKIHETNAGTDKMTRIKSSRFQFEEK